MPNTENTEMFESENLQTIAIKDHFWISDAFWHIRIRSDHETKLCNIGIDVNNPFGAFRILN